jgi:glycosyltransferase involved in cell wall biosynthesis
LIRVIFDAVATEMSDTAVLASHGPVESVGAALPEFSGLRVLLVHQWLYTWAGAERVLSQLADMIPQADILTGIVTPQMRHERALASRATETWVGRLPFARSRHRWFLPAHALAFFTYDTRAYDLVVSISHAFEKMVRARRPGGLHVSYCLSPPRYLWDLDAEHDALATPAQRIALRAARAPLRIIDRHSADHVHRFVSLSRTVADRVRATYGRDSTVVYPPVQAKPTPIGRSRRTRFLLSLGRLVPYKRVDLAILAAERLGVRLIVAGDGPERARLERLAGRQTEFLGNISEEHAGSLLSTCAAFVFCAEEDFGIAPVEALSHGAPVVAYARGGALETIRDGVSGIFFDEQHVDAVSGAIARCLDRSWDEPALRACADQFSPERFRAGIRAEFAAALAGRAR